MSKLQLLLELQGRTLAISESGGERWDVHKKADNLRNSRAREEVRPQVFFATNRYALLTIGIHTDGTAEDLSQGGIYYGGFNG